jgi:hypothetical protein
MADDPLAPHTVSADEFAVRLEQVRLGREEGVVTAADPATGKLEVVAYVDPIGIRLQPAPRARVRPRERRAAPRRTRRAGAARARAPGRPEDDPEPPLEVVPLERFRHDVDAWRGGAA